MRTYDGTLLTKKSNAIGVLTNKNDVIPRGNFILYKDNTDFSDFGFKGYITKSDKLPPFSRAGVRINNGDSINQHFGDIIRISSEGQIQVLWEAQSTQNALFLTDACNVNCIMCPQPQKAHDKENVTAAHRILDLLRGQNVSSICITGGEPTLLKNDFLSILKRCTDEHPYAHINILTNGQALHDFEYAKQCALNSSIHTCFCVSMHGDNKIIHDRIVQKNGAFHNVHSTLYNLSKLKVGIEIRFVVSKLNYMRLPNLPDFFFRSYPFVHHFAIMGLEMSGCAANNIDEIWIDPIDYQSQINKFVIEAERRGINFSIYNHQLCTLPKNAWIHAKQSISKWKQTFIKQCAQCDIQDQCGGFFATSKNLISREIKPVIL